MLPTPFHLRASPRREGELREPRVLPPRAPLPATRGSSAGHRLELLPSPRVRGEEGDAGVGEGRGEEERALRRSNMEARRRSGRGSRWKLENEE
ncbi:unnamed protein product [Urochloa humidicola]